MSIYPTNLNKQVEQIIEGSSQRPITLVQYLPCLVVSSETKLSTEQSMLFARLEAKLRKKGFSPIFWRTLGNKNSENPWNQIESNNNLFSIVFLDGLTPNLLYKYGILKGTGKTVILLQSKNAQTTIKGLYNSAADSGLEAKVFHHNFSDPSIDLSNLLPLLNVDYLGSIDPQATSGDAFHLDSIFQEAFAATENAVMESLKKRVLFHIPSEYAEEFTALFGIFEEYYHCLFTDSEFGQIASLQTVYPSIKRAAEYYHFAVPHEFARLLASSFIFLALQKQTQRTEKEFSLNLALEIYQDQLKGTDNQLEQAFLSKEIGAIQTELLVSSGSKEYADAATQAFQQALQFYSSDLYPLEFGIIQNNLGIIQFCQALFSHSQTRLESAITSFQNAGDAFQNVSLSQYSQISNFNLGLTLSLETDEANPNYSEAVQTAFKEFIKTADITDVDLEILARINQNCGLLYHQLIKTEPTEANYDRMVKFFHDALRFWNSGSYSIECAIAWATIGEASLKIAETFHSSHYFQQAINSFFEFFKIYPSKDSRMWGQAERSLGDAYLGLASFEENMAHFHSAISFYLEALGYFNAENFPSDFLGLQNKLAMIYHRVAKTENSASDYHQAIAAWNEALKVIPQDDIFQHAQISLKIAQSYRELASLEEFLENIHLASGTYHHITAALGTNHDTEKALSLYQEALYGLGNTAMDLAVHEDALKNYHAALDAFEEAFHSGPIKQNQIEILSQLADACWNLASLEEKSLPYCKKALEAYQKLLSNDNFRESKQSFAKIQARLGDIFAILADYEEQKKNYHAGIGAYETALQNSNTRDEKTQAGDDETLMTAAEIAMIHKKRGDLLLKLAVTEDTLIHCEAAIQDYDTALSYYIQSTSPKEYAEIQQNRGAAFQRLADLEGKAEHSREAISAYLETLKIYTFGETPRKFGAVQKELGIAYLNLFQFEQNTQYCHQAVEAFQLALKTYTKENNPLEYAMIQNQLGNAFFNVAENEDSLHLDAIDNYNQAVVAFEEAASIYSGGTLPQDYITTQMNLGFSYVNLAKVHKDPAQYQKAIAIFEKILQNEILEKSSFHYAMIYFKMGDACYRLAELTQEPETCKKAIAANQEALKTFSMVNFPMYFAAAYKGIADSYGILSAIERKTIYFVKILESFKEVLKVYTPVAPLYASIQQEIGDYYVQWAKLENPAENYHSAISSYQESLTVWTAKNDTIQYKKTQWKLASSYVKLAEFKDADSFYQKAIAAFQEALPDSSDADNTDSYSEIKENLGDLFYRLALMNHDKALLQQGIQSYADAATPLALKDAIRSAALQEKQGDCFSLAAKFEEPNDNYQKALLYYQRLLTNLDPANSEPLYARLLVKTGEVSESLASLENNLLLHQQAIDYLLKSLPLTAQDLKHSADTYQLIGDIYFKLSQNAESLNHCRKAMQMYQQSAHFYTDSSADIELALLQIKIGAVYQKLAELDEPIENSQKAIEMYLCAGKVIDNTKFSQEFTTIHYQMGNVHYKLAKTVDAPESFHNALLCYEVALPHLKADAEAGEEYITALKNLGDIYNHLLELTDSEEYLSNSIAVFQELLRLTPKEQSPLEYAEYQIIIAKGYSRQATIKNAAENYQLAIPAYLAALEIYNEHQDPLKLTLIQKNLADIYHQLALMGESTDYLTQSISWYKVVLPYYLDSDPEEAALLNQKLGTDFVKLFNTNQELATLKKGLAAFQESIKIFQGLASQSSVVSNQELSSDFLITAYSQMGDIYRKLSDAEPEAKEAHLKNAIFNYELVTQKVREIGTITDPAPFRNLGEAYLLLAETIHHNKASASLIITNCQAALKILQEAWLIKPEAVDKYLSGRSMYLLAQYDDPSANFPKSLIAFGECLQFWTFEQEATRWAEIQHRMGQTYSLLAEHTDAETNYKHAVESFQAAMKIRTYEHLPLEFGFTQMELAKVYRELAELEVSETNSKLAIEAFTKAARVFEPESYPLQYANCQRNLGEIHHRLSEFETPDGHELAAIAAYHNALNILENYPADPNLGLCHFNLGNAYLRLAGISDTAEYCKKSIDSYHLAQTAGIDSQSLGEFYENLGTAHSMLWDVENRLQDKELAFSNLRLALAQYQQSEAWVSFALTQHKIGLIHQKTAMATMKHENWKNAIEAYQDALRVLNEQEQPDHYAATHEKLGESYFGLAEWENSVINYNRAVDAYQEALKIWTAVRFPKHFVRVQQKSGLVYERLAELEEKTVHLHSALATYRQAIKAQSIEAAPAIYAGLQKNVGVILNTLAEDTDTLPNCQAAIIAFEEALRVYSRENYPLDYAVVRHHLGNSYRLLAKFENQIQNCQKAITYYEEAISIFDSFNDNLNSLDYAALQNNLGNAYLMLSDLKDTEKYSLKAVASFKNALKHYNPKNQPKECATLQENIAKTLQHLAEMTSEIPVYREAADAYQKAMKIYTVQSFPNQFANIQWNLGKIYLGIAKLVAPEENLSRAIPSFQAALNILRIKDLINASLVQYQLGVAYSALADFNDKAANSKLALQSFDEALKKKNSGQLPRQSAAVLYAQGLAFQKLASMEDSKENYQHSITCFNEALSIIVDQNQESPQEKAGLQKALGDSYYALAELKTEVEPLRKASEEYQKALEHFTLKNDPAQFAAIQKNLGNIFLKLAHFGDKLNHCNQAIKAYQEGLQIYLPQEHLHECISMMDTLGDAYRYLSETGDEIINCQKAIEIWEKALTFTPAEFEDTHSINRIQMKLGDVYQKLFQLRHLTNDSKKALSYFETALKTATQRRLDEEQLDIQFKIGRLYIDLTGGQSSNPSLLQQNYKKAIQIFREITKATSVQYMGKYYADSQYELGNIYYKMADIEKSSGNLKLAIRCFEEALKVRNADTYPLDFAATQVSLADAYYHYENLDDHYQLAIEAYQKAADIYNEKKVISDYSQTLDKLGKTYRSKAELTLDPDCFQRAIACLEEFLDTGLVAEQSQDYADTKSEIGYLYLKMGQYQEPETNYQAAIGYYTSAASVFLQLKATDLVERTECSLGDAYHQLARTNGHIEDYKNAIHAYEDALKFVTKQENTQEYAFIQKSLGEIYESLASLGYEAEHFEKAVTFYKESLTCLNDKDLYFNIIQQHLGDAYLRLAEFKDPLNNCNKAMEALKKTLQNRNVKHLGQQSAVWNSIANAHAFLARLSRDPGNWKKAINAYREALKSGSDERLTPSRSNIQKNLGKALFYLAEYEDPIDNCKLAIYVCQEALQGLSSSVQDLECSEILGQLGNTYYVLAVADLLKSDDQVSWLAYQELASDADLGKAPEWFTIAYIVPDKETQSLAIVEEKKSNCLQAIESFQKALEIYSFDKNSYEYALIRQSLGNAYQTCFEADENIDNLKNAISAYQEALRIWNVESDPLNHVNSIKCLGNAYQKLARREELEVNAKKAIEVYEAALDICSLERFPLNYGILYDNIKACCYLLAENDNNVDIYKKIFEACEEALKVFTKHKFPKKYRLLRYEMDNLVNLLID